MNDYKLKFSSAIKIKNFVSKIPYFGTPDVPLTSTTQNALPIADIVDDVVLYKDGGAAIVLETSSLNFGLLSEKEQGAVVAAYAALINSLSFSISPVGKFLAKFWAVTSNNVRRFEISFDSLSNFTAKSV